MEQNFVESQILELKREYSDGIRKTVIAFANTDGGKLIVGVDDDGTVVGLSNTHDDMLKISNSLRDAICPDVMMFISMWIDEINEKQVIIIQVERGTSCPYYLGNKGIRPEGVFIRQGASTVPASDAAILKMIRETSGNRYEIARSIEQNLTFSQTEKYFLEKNIEFGETQHKTLGLIGDDNTYSNLAFLLSDQCTHSIKFASFSGSHKEIFKERHEFTGSVLFQLEGVYEIIDKYNALGSTFSGLFRIDRKDYPDEVIREVLLNAVAHREYGISASTLVSIFDDRIEVLNVGGLIKGVTLSDIMLGVSASRNPNLANVLYRLELVEAYGTGMKKIMRNYEEYDFKPSVELSDNAFKVSLPNINYYRIQDEVKNKKSMELRQDLTEREAEIVEMIVREKSITRKDIEYEIGVSQATATRLLSDLLKKDIIKRLGSGNRLKYTLNEEI